MTQRARARPAATLAPWPRKRNPSATRMTPKMIAYRPTIQTSRHQAGPGEDRDDDAERHRQEAVQDQEPLALDLPAEPDRGGDAKDARHDGPCAGDHQEREGRRQRA